MRLSKQSKNGHHVGTIDRPDQAMSLVLQFFLVEPPELALMNRPCPITAVDLFTMSNTTTITDLAHHQDHLNTP